MNEIDWNAYARDYDALLALRPYRELQQAVAEAVLDTDIMSQRILDAACGTGNTSRAITERAAKLGRTPEIRSIDSAEAMLMRAREKCGDDRVAFARADLDRTLPFRDRTFDVVASVNTLYAVADPVFTLREFARVLRPGGRLVLVTPKAGYENGLVLKEHCESAKPDAYWCGIHRSPGRETALVREALSDEHKAAEAMLRVAAHNRRINQMRTFHFLTAHDLFELCASSGHSVLRHSLSYAKQCHIVVLKRSP